MEDRKTVLLRACLDLLERQFEATHILYILGEEVTYDGVTCNGYSLMEDIENELNGK